MNVVDQNNLTCLRGDMKTPSGQDRYRYQEPTGIVSTCMRHFGVLLTVHLSITLANDQLDAQFLYFTIRLLQSSTCFEQRRAHHQEVKLY